MVESASCIHFDARECFVNCIGTSSLYNELYHMYKHKLKSHTYAHVCKTKLTEYSKRRFRWRIALSSS